MAGNETEVTYTFNGVTGLYTLHCRSCFHTWAEGALDKLHYCPECGKPITKKTERANVLDR